MAHKFNSEEEALKTVKDYGAKVEDDLIFPPEEYPFSRISMDVRDKFWDAMAYLQIEHDYRNANNVPFFNDEY